MTQQWKKSELDDWARGWTRTPQNVLKAFIDAGFCSDQAPSRDEMRLLRQPTPSTSNATKAVMPELREAIFDSLGSELVSTYDCTRVWEAWSVGTMGQNDFSPVNDRLDEIVDAIMAAIAERQGGAA